MTARDAKYYNKSMTEIVSVKDPSLIKDIAAMADEIWHECYKGIISDSQIDYMVNNFQSEKAMKRLFDDGAEFYSIISDGEPSGYIVLEKEADSLFLSKLYTLAKVRGKGIGSTALKFVKKRALELGYPSVYLHVNKFNFRAIKAYLANGFKNERTLDTEIGEGFVMEDYIMRAKAE